MNENPKWTKEIRELEDFFAERKLPEKVRLDSWNMIVDCKLFVDTHMSIVHYHNGNDVYLPYLNRLIEIKNILQNGRETD